MDEHVFKSKQHPNGSRATSVYARCVVRPLAFMMLIGMVLTLLVVLEQGYVLPTALMSFGIALIASAAWTHYHIRVHPVEVRVRDGHAAVRTIWDVATQRPVHWQRILDLRDTRDTRTITVGHRTFDLKKTEWSCVEEMSDVLRRARTRKSTKPTSAIE